MKKIVICLMAAGLLLTFNPQISKAAIASTTSNLIDTKPTEITTEKTLLLRLDEIKSMNKSNMTSGEKKELRAEVLSIQRELRPYHHREYISIGTVLLIVLLLIILV